MRGCTVWEGQQAGGPREKGLATWEGKKGERGRREGRPRRWWSCWVRRWKSDRGSVAEGGVMSVRETSVTREGWPRSPKAPETKGARGPKLGTLST